MKSNAIVLTDRNGEEIYITDVDLYCDEYIESLPNPELIFKPKTFIGLLDFLYEHIIKDLPYRTSKRYDYHLLDGVFFRIYKPICARYGQTPTIFGFASMCHIDHTNLTDLRQGRYRGEGYKVDADTSQIVKRWFSVCQSAAVSVALDSTTQVGSIFILKAAYGMSDQAKEEPEPKPEREYSAYNIAMKYGAVEMPTLPVIDD